MPRNNVDDYGWSASQDPHSCGYLAPHILRLVAGMKVRRILDLGAGNGALCAVLAEAGYEVVGVENDHQGAELARATHPNIKFYTFGVQDDPSDLLATEQPFDLVISTEVVEHLYSPHLLPLYAKGVLNSDGVLIVTTPYHGYLKNLALSVVGRWDAHLSPLWHGGHIKFWSRSTLSLLLERNGFHVIGFSGVGRVPLLWKSMVLVSKVL